MCAGYSDRIIVIVHNLSEKLGSCKPVSYTHLDVYKRQMKVRNLGRKSLEEVLAKLKELGLELNQTEE